MPAWARLQSRTQWQNVLAETGGPRADILDMPDYPTDIATLRCIAAGPRKVQGSTTFGSGRVGSWSRPSRGTGKFKDAFRQKGWL